MGWYGNGNLGDEALLRCIIEEISSKYKNAQIFVFCSNGETVSREHKVNAISRTPLNRFFVKLRLLYSSNVFLLGGGTMLCDNQNWIKDLFAITSLMFWPLLAKIFRVPTMAFGHGVGPAKNAAVQFSIRYLFTKIDVVALRDRTSKNLMKELVGKNCKALTTCDPVVTSTSFEPNNILSKLDKTSLLKLERFRPYTVVSLRYFLAEKTEAGIPFYKRFSKVLSLFYTQTQSRLILFPAQISNIRSDDREIILRLKDALINFGVPDNAIIYNKWESIEEAAALLQMADLVVSNRLHSLLIAARVGVALVGIVHQDKIKGCLEMIGFNSACTFIEQFGFNEQEAYEAMINAWHTRKEKRLQIQEGVRRWAQNHPTNMDILDKLLFQTSN
jgi:polysaccharide pyruvyl transferase WcaK-like protein